MRVKLFLIIIFFIAALFNAKTVAYSSERDTSSTSTDLYVEIATMDSIFFDAFNARNLEKIKSMFTDDLEFYHDVDGLSYYEENIESTKRLFKQNTGLRRELVKSSLEVYPINNYGAIEIGIHTFCHEEKGMEDCGTFRFFHVWRKENDVWKISRVFSYSH